MRISAIAVALLFLTASLYAAQPAPQKMPWQWSLDERLAVRNDPVAAAERVRSAGSRGSKSSVLASKASGLATDQTDFISGREHPELLLAWEIFDYLMRMGYADDVEVRSIFRESKIPSLKAASLPADFWQRMEMLAVAYLSDSRQLRDLHARPQSNPSGRTRLVALTASLESLRCRDRAAAIEAARHEFGESFDRFLYQAVAPSLTITVGRQGHIAAERQHEIEKGCQ